MICDVRWAFAQDQDVFLMEMQYSRLFHLGKWMGKCRYDAILSDGLSEQIRCLICDIIYYYDTRYHVFFCLLAHLNRKFTYGF